MRNANPLLRWLRKNTDGLGVWLRRLRGPCVLTVVSDSAFKAQDYEGLVMRGFVVILREQGDLMTGSSCACHLLDWSSRKHGHVVRSTYAAELHSLLDALNQAFIIAYSLTELMWGPQPALALVELFRTGSLAVSVEGCLDARSVYDSVTAEAVRTPADRHLLVHALAVREYLENGALTTLTWLDTLDTLPDGLTKGAVEPHGTQDARQSGRVASDWSTAS